MTTIVPKQAVVLATPRGGSIGSPVNFLEITPSLPWPSLPGGSRSVPGWIPFRIAVDRSPKPNIDAIAAHGLPSYAVGTSTAHVGILSTLGLYDPSATPVWGRPTAIDYVNDIRAVLAGTSFVELTYDNVSGDPFQSTKTRMGELRALAPGLSLREWADGFGVTKQAINNWVTDDPRERPELDAAIATLRAACRRHAELSAWLRSALPRSDRRPLDLMRDHQWRALRAAARLKPAVGAGVMPTPDMSSAARSRRSVSKQLGGGDAPPAPDEE
jgi:hypothetical protein